jgi:HSP20 family protein
MNERATATKMALAPVPTKTIEPQNVFEQFEHIYDSIARRAYEIFEGNGKRFGRDLEDWFQAESELLHPLKINMSETDSQVTVQAEVPGFTEKDLEVHVEPRQLTISGKRETSEEQKKGKTIYQEHRSNEILRLIELPAEVNTEKVTAILKNGILELQMAKGPAVKGTRIEVKAA